MNTISNKINKMYEKLFITKDKIHPFINDINKSKNLAKGYRNKIKKYIKLETDYKKLIEVTEINKEKHYDELKSTDLVSLNKESNSVLNYAKILQLVSYISRFMIKSNVKDYDKLYNDIRNDNTINVMIIGSGPVGLFLACYLSLYYNNTAMNSATKINVVLFDNRIEKSGFRKPFSRQRMFATTSKYLNLIIPKLFCWEKNKDFLMINIFIIEYILYEIALNEYNIKMIYEDYTWDDYKKIIDKGNFKVVFDCSGGRLKHEVIKNINPKWLNNIKLNYRDIKLKVEPENNMVYLKKHDIMDYYFGSMMLYDNDLNLFKKFDFDIMIKEDLFNLNKIKNKYYDYNDSINIIKSIKNKMTRNFLFNLIQGYDKYLFMFDIWGVNIKHQIKISDTFKVNNREILLIGAGDTIFHSHFIVGAGLNRTLDFSVKCANMLLFL
jgi:hypothetical protein